MSNADSSTCNAIKALTPRQMVYSLFDRDKTIIIPVKNGKPVNPEWRTLTLPQTNTPDYDFELACQDLAVVCGAGSHNLAGLIFHDLKQREEFLAKNPPLQNTLLATCPDGFVVWIRIDGWIPRNYKHPICDCIFRADYVIVAAVEKGSKYHCDNERQPVVVQFQGVAPVSLRSGKNRALAGFGRFDVAGRGTPASQPQPAAAMACS